MHKRAQGLEGDSIVEKIANAPKGVPAGDDATPVETPEDVKQLAEAQQEQAAPARGDTSATDAIVQAAKAMRDGKQEEVAQVVAQTCLVVDDSRVIRKVSSKIARSLGYEVIEAQDGLEALARCKQAMPELVLTDWDMPEMDGLEFVKNLRAIPTSKPPTVVFCTSKGQIAEIQAGVQAGADDYIVKPFDEGALRAKLEKLGQK